MKGLTNSQAFNPDLARTGHYKRQIGPKWGENVIFKHREWYYIVSMYKYYQLTLFLVLIWKFDQKSNFHHRLAGTKPYECRLGKKHWEKYGSQELGVVLHSFYV